MLLHVLNLPLGNHHKKIAHNQLNEGGNQDIHFIVVFIIRAKSAPKLRIGWFKVGIVTEAPASATECLTKTSSSPCGQPPLANARILKLIGTARRPKPVGKGKEQNKQLMIFCSERFVHSLPSPAITNFSFLKHFSNEVFVLFNIHL